MTKKQKDEFIYFYEETAFKRILLFFKERYFFNLSNTKSIVNMNLLIFSCFNTYVVLVWIKYVINDDEENCSSLEIKNLP